MTYSEFSKMWVAKNYAGSYGAFTASSITMTTENYERRGSRWGLVSKNTEEIHADNYAYTIDAVPFFRRLGGSERVTCSYTMFGYLPVSVSSISPDRAKKVVRSFTFA